MGMSEEADTVDRGTENPQSGDLVPLFTSLWQQRWLIFACGVLMAASCLGYSYLMPEIYTARVTILPRQGANNSALLGQIASFTGTSFESGSFFEVLYEQIIKSDRILNLLMEQAWPSKHLDEPAGLERILGLADGNGDERSQRYAAFRVKEKLRKNIISVTRDKVTGYTVLKVGVRDDPELSALIANFLVDQLDSFLKDFRSAKAIQNRQFIEGRLITATAELEQAERQLTDFILKNRSYASSPQLMEEYRAREREVASQSSIWVELRRQRETARIEEHRDAINIDVLDRATPPFVRSSPLRMNMTIGGLFFGLCLGAAYVLGRDQYRRIVTNRST